MSQRRDTELCNSAALVPPNYLEKSWSSQAGQSPAAPADTVRCSRGSLSPAIDPRHTTPNLKLGFSSEANVLVSPSPISTRYPPNRQLFASPTQSLFPPSLVTYFLAISAIRINTTANHPTNPSSHPARYFSFNEQRTLFP
ncbi:hypothetical protein MGYG_05624 [Nannizzia gypsea CBS 118893]|uniref:Uncharacterized protein n=1 Tax=Arthroderma gypseum (strain ATCC MYA-4604 / CBS 118893) TaxID=535722 RepID=E4UWY8_ARTGP|nr:hypothetical protein MGYG_05624 [Nannizzia gypsea CBS 118893]EFR02627.1 hypothetical protein MGYG_05624 [Nannizzia gypsea CBS 118893]